MRCRAVCADAGGGDGDWYVVFSYLSFLVAIRVLICLYVAKFQQYMYGGRPLDVRFNDRWHTFTPSAAKGGQVMPMDGA